MDDRDEWWKRKSAKSVLAEHVNDYICIWPRVMVIRWLYFYLINKRNPYRWVSVVYWLNYLILAVDLRGSTMQHQVKRAVGLRLGFSCLHNIHHAASHGFWGSTCRLEKYLLSLEGLPEAMDDRERERESERPLLSARHDEDIYIRVKISSCRTV